MLAISDGASAVQVRTAYLTLIKAHHPDVGGDAQAGDGAALINRAYWWLGNEERRRRYDARRIGASRTTLRSDRIVAAAPAVPLGEKAAARGGRRFYEPACALLAMAGAALLLFAYDARLAPATEVVRSRSASQGAAPEVRRTAIRQALADFDGIAAAWGRDGAERYSGRCYARLAQGGARTKLGYCAAFDLAADDAYRMAEGFFAAPERRRRFLWAARALGIDADAYWREINEDTQRELGRAAARAQARPLRP